MVRLVDTAMWVDYFRSQTPDAVKRQVGPIARDPEIVLCEPVLFELLRAAPKAQRFRLREYLSTIPVLMTPADLWNAATLLGQRCVDRGVSPVRRTCSSRSSAFTTS